MLERLSAPVMEAVAIGDRRVETGPGNVFEPREELDAVTGGWRGRRRHRFGGPIVAARAAAGELVGRGRG